MPRSGGFTSQLYRAALRPVSLGTASRRAALMALVTAAVVATATAAASERTQLTIYHAFTASGAPTVRVTSTIRGHCWTGSLSSPRADAWRCMSSNFIYDPCFSSTSVRGIVLCPATGLWSSAAIEIRLTQSLPTNYGNQDKPSTAGLPWALVTTSGWKCLLDTGAAGVINGRRANYVCSRTKDWLWGAPRRRSEPWRIYAAPVSAAKLSRMVSIRAVWF
jgi:hypothetical protein